MFHVSKQISKEIIALSPCLEAHKQKAYSDDIKSLFNPICCDITRCIKQLCFVCVCNCEYG